MSAPSCIIITGFMAAGKTSVATALAQRLHCEMIDLDQFITEREGRTVPQIIDEDGLAKFREIETRALHDALQSKAARVIALGGGAWTLERNRALIAQYNGFTVWLDAPFELCWQRIMSGESVRPLARDKDKAHCLFNERRALYELADQRIEVRTGQSVQEIVAEIAGLLPQHLPAT